MERRGLNSNHFMVSNYGVITLWIPDAEQEDYVSCFDAQQSCFVLG